MNRSAAITLSLLALVGVAAVVWLSSQSSPTSSTGRSGPPSSVRTDVDHTPRKPVPPLDSNASQGGYVAAAGQPPDADATSAVPFSARLVQAVERTPVPAVRVMLTPATNGTSLLATSDADGRIRVDALAPGEYDLSLDDDFWATVERSSVSVAASASEAEIACRLGGLVTGRVVDPRGQPVSAASVTVRQVYSMEVLYDVQADPKRARETATVQTDSLGRFRVRGVPPLKAANVFVGHPAFAPAKSAKIAVRATEETPVPIIALAPGGGIAGSVRDGAGAPIGSATVKVEKRVKGFADLIEAYGSEPEGASAAPKATTDDQGKFRMEHLEPGEKTLTASAPGFVSLRKSGVEVEEGREIAGLDLRLERGASIEGTVLGPDLKPVEGAMIRLEIDPMERARGKRPNRQPSRSGPDGRFRLAELAAEPVDLSIAKSGFAKAVKRGVKPGSEPLEVVLSRGACFEGRVRIAATGESVPEFKLKAAKMESMAFVGSSFSETTSNEVFHDGVFELCGLEAGTYSIEVSARDFAPARLEKIEVAAEARVSDLLLELRKACEIRGTVRRSSDGRPIQGALITVGEPNPMGEFLTMMAARQNEGTLSARSLTDGTFSLKGVAPGVVNLLAIHGEHPSASVGGIQVSEEGPTTGIEILMPAAARLSGTVFASSGRPDGGAMVMLMKGFMPARQTAADEAGRYEMAGLAAGDYSLMRIALQFDDSGVTPGGGSESVPVTLHEGDDVVVDLGRPASGSGCKLHGRITLGGEPVRDTSLQLLHERAEASSTFSIRGGVTDADGRYAIEGIAPGSYVLQILTGEWGQGTFGAGVEIGEEREKRLDVELPRGAIVGRVLDAETKKPIKSVVVYATPEAEAKAGADIRSMMSGRVSQAISTEDGRYAIRPLAAGRYQIRAGSLPFDVSELASDYATEIIEGVESPEAGEATLDLFLERAAKIEGIVRDATGSVVSGAYVSLFDNHGVNVAGPLVLPSGADGRNHITALKEGRYWLRASSPQHALSPRRAVNVQSGKTVTEDIVLTPGGSLAVSVTAEARPVADATIEIVDEDGQVVPGLVSIFQIFTDPGSGGETEPGVRLYSHVAPGRYDVRARHRDFGEGSATVTVRAEALSSVRVTLE